MTIASTARKAGPLLGDNSTTTFPFSFKVFAEGDIAVTAADADGIETLLVLGADYSVTLNPNQETSPGGTVTYPISGDPLPVGSVIVIVGALDYDQPLDLPAGGNFPPLSLENQLDRTVMQVQQLREEVSRSVRASVTTSADVVLPAPVASRLIGWDQNGTGLQNFDTADLFSAAVYANWLFDTFSGTGSTTAFALQRAPGNVANCDVSVDGQTYVPNLDFTISGNILAFTVAPLNGSQILVRYGQAAQQVSSTFSTEVLTASAAQTVFNLTGATYTPGANNIAVYVNGLRLTPGVDFTETDSNTITTTSGLQASDEVLFVCGRTLNDAVAAEQVSFLPANEAATSVHNYLRRLPSTASPSDGDAMIGELRTSIGAVATTLHDHNERRKFDVAIDFGVDSGSPQAAVKAALQQAISAASGLPNGGLVEVPAYLNYGLNTEDSTTWPSFIGVTVPVTVLDYSAGSSYSGYPTSYDGAQVRVWTFTPQTVAALSFTAPLSSAAVSATLSANWPRDTGLWTVTFSNGDARAVTLTNGATSATWSPGLSSGATASAIVNNPGQHDGNTQWLRGPWAPVFCISNDADLRPAGHADRRAMDNRRAGVAFMVDGDATWQLIQGTRSGAGLTDEELSNLAIQKFAAPGDTLGDYTPWLVERKTSYVSYGGGRNLPSAHHHFEPSSGSPSTYLVVWQETGGSRTRTVWRDPAGNTSNDVAAYNDSTVWGLNTPVGDALHVSIANRRVWIPGSLRYRASTPAYGASVSIDTTLGNLFRIKANNGTAFSILQPLAGEDGCRILIRVYNTTAGALGAITFSSAYNLAGSFVAPGPGNNRAIEFEFDSTADGGSGAWLEISRSSADIPN